MNHIKIVLSFTLFFVLALNLFTQDMNYKSNTQDKSDSIITGKKYRIILFNDKEIIGRVIKQDSVQIQMTSDNTVYRFKKEDIFEISSELTPSKLKAIFWAGGGIGLFDMNDSRSNYEKGFTFQLSGMYPLADTRGIRVDFGYSRWKGIPNYYYYEPYTPSSNSEQTINSYYVKTNFVFGTFSPSDKFKFYGFPGIGINFRNESEYTYYSYYENTVNTYPPRNFSGLLLSFGGGLGYLFNKKIGLYGEAEYNFSFYHNFVSGYFLAKAGVTFNVF